MQQFDNPADARTLGLAIVGTFPEPFPVLDEELRVLAASPRATFSPRLPIAA